MIVVGLNAFHADASAVLVAEGKVIAAIEEERFTRIKHWAGNPIESVRACLEIAGVNAQEVDHWAINTDNGAHRFRKYRYMLSNPVRLRLVLSRLQNRLKRSRIEQNLAAAFSLDEQGITVHRVEHHLSHLASAFYPSAYEQALAVSIDGFGDFSSAGWGLGNKDGIQVDGYVQFPHSLGIFYQALTQYLGFREYGDEYKVMGLAPYGKPVFLEKLEGIVSMSKPPSYRLNLAYFRHHRHPILVSREQGRPDFDTLYSPLMEDLLGPARSSDEELTQRHKDIAASIQGMYERCLFSMLDALHKRYKIGNLALAGGCAMNSVANGKICQRTGFDSVYVQPAAGDAGGALGAALELTRRLAGELVTDPMPHAYLGPSFSSSAISDLIARERSRIEAAGCLVISPSWDTLGLIVVEALMGGKVVGWFQGRMEWGARALGNRSILGDPRRSDMQSILNHKIKRRESFRPFAPSILREQVVDWFDVDDDVPYMQKVYKIKDQRKAQIPAVTHVDGSGRLQTVTQQQNPLFYRLIKTFFDHTGVPLLLNTSFNENEPIVCKPEEALECFLRTQMDVLALENVLIYRNGC